MTLTGGEMSYLMIVITNILSLVQTVLQLYVWVVIISALISWVNPDPYNPIVRILKNLTDPVLYRIRRWMPFVVVGGMDLSPLVVIFGVQILNGLISRGMMDLMRIMQ
ncbi:MAG: YggT family protein [Desulfovibrio sp.]